MLLNKNQNFKTGDLFLFFHFQNVHQNRQGCAAWAVEQLQIELQRGVWVHARPGWPTGNDGHVTWRVGIGHHGGKRAKPKTQKADDDF